MNDRAKRLAWNTISSAVYQVIAIACGFIVPRLILGQYGSETNGLVSSIQQFLQIIAFLELGVGAVVKSSLYEPLAKNDVETISKIVASANRFFRRIAAILAVYVAVLVIVYPRIVSASDEMLATAFLIVAMSISSFAQYYFGIVNQLLLNADQKGYIQYITQSITLIVNTILCVILIRNGNSIQLVKLTTSLVFLCRPIVYKIYVDKHYCINKNISYSEEPIKQKWNGIAQHVAAIVLDGTNVIVLTLFSTLTNVSIYYVYQMVANGVKQLFISTTNGIQSLMGELWARKEKDRLKEFFSWVEWSIHTGAVFLFGCTGLLILPFVGVYTAGIEDANYQVPIFALFMILAQVAECIRLPYNIMILAAGHYKQTQHIFIIAAIINIIVSVVTVKVFGLPGVAIGTICAMVYQDVSMAKYVTGNLVDWSFSRFLRQTAVDAITLIVIYAMNHFLMLSANTYIAWFILAIKVTALVGGVVVCINMIFYKEKMRTLAVNIVKRIKR